MLANWVTLLRLPLLLMNVLILFYGSAVLQLFGVGLLFIGIMLDTVDGLIARKLGQTSLFGSVLDIAADRTFELVLWVCFANLGLIPLVVPLIVIARTTLTDAFRSIGVSHDAAPFKQHRSALGQFIVGSPWMRTGYAVTKTVSFCGLALAVALQGFPAGSAAARAVAPMMEVLEVVVWIAVAFCVFRGLPVILGTLRRYWGAPTAAT